MSVNLTLELLDCQDQKHSFKTMIKQPCFWKLSPQGMYYIKVDGAISSKKSCLAVGMVIKNASGAFIMGKAQKFSRVMSPLIVEIMAIKEALLWCLGAGITKGEIRTNSKSIASMAYSSSLFLGPEMFLLKNVKLLSHCNPGFNYCFIYKRNKQSNP